MTAGSGGAAPPGARHPKRGEGFQVAVLKRRPLTQLPYKNLPLLPRHVRGDPRGRQHQLGRDTLRLHGVHKLPEPPFTNRGAGENAALACKISCIAQRRAIPSTLHSRRAASKPSFPPQSLPGVRSSPKPGCSFRAAAPSARDAAARAQRKVLLTHRRRSRAAAPAWLDTLRGQVPSPKNLQRRAPSPQPRLVAVLSTNPGQRKTRASLSRENTVISRYFALLVPPPPPAARDLAQKMHLGAR